MKITFEKDSGLIAQADFRIVNGLGQFELKFWCDISDYDVYPVVHYGLGDSKFEVLGYSETDGLTLKVIWEPENKEEENLLLGSIYEGGEPHKNDFSWVVFPAKESTYFVCERVNFKDE